MGRVARGKSVSTIPGSSVVTRMPNGRHSTASASAIADIPHFDAWYMPSSGLEIRAPIDDTNTSEPPPASRIAGSAAWITAAAPNRLVSNMRRTSSRSTSSIAPSTA